MAPSRQERRKAERAAAKRAPAPAAAAGAAGGAAAAAKGDVNVNPLGDWQGLALAHFSAQLQRFLWDRGCAQGLCSPC